MAKNVMLFGAGASVQAGAPVMSNFLDVARELVFEHQDQKTATSFNNVFGAISRLQAVHSKAEFDIKNLESIFTAFELAKTVRKFPGTEPAEIDGLIEDLKRVIIATLESTMKFEREDLELRAPGPYREFLKKLLHGPNPTSLALLTFN